MKLLLDVPGLLGHRIHEALVQQHEVQVLHGDPRDRTTASDATRQADVVISAVRVVSSPQADPLAALDRASRGVFNLITTASAAGAKRFVLLSSLRPFERYPLDHAVTEFWAPPPTTDLDDLLPFLAEAVVREASHALPLQAVCLRMGTVVDGQEAPDTASSRGRSASPGVARHRYAPSNFS